MIPALPTILACTSRTSVSVLLWTFGPIIPAHMFSPSFLRIAFFSDLLRNQSSYCDLAFAALSHNDPLYRLHSDSNCSLANVCFLSPHHSELSANCLPSFLLYLFRDVERTSSSRVWCVLPCTMAPHHASPRRCLLFHFVSLFARRFLCVILEVVVVFMFRLSLRRSSPTTFIATTITTRVLLPSAAHSHKLSISAMVVVRLFSIFVLS